MKRKIFSKLLMVALVIAAVGSFVSCKDYDDDINNLQKQIDTKAAISELTALQSTLDSKIAAAQSAAQAAQATADAAATKTAVADLKTALEAAIADAKKAGTDAGTQAGEAIAAANKAQETADGAAAAAKKADEDAKAALADALKTIAETYETKADAAAKAAEAKTAIEAVKEALAAVKQTADAAFTKAEAEKLQEQVNNLKADLESQIEEKVKEAIKNVDNAVASVDAIWSAVTSVELIDSYSGASQGLGLNTVNEDQQAGVTGNPINLILNHGKVGAESSVFGDNEAIYNNKIWATGEPTVEYEANAEINFEDGVIVRVNPVSADITSAKILLVNSKGEALDDYVVFKKAERYNELITTTRGTSINTGLWKVQFTMAEGKTINDVKGATFKDIQFNAKGEVKEDTDDEPILFAVAINNTDNAEERFVASSYDIVTDATTYVPAFTFGFSVDKKTVETLKNRWNGETTIAEDDTEADVKEYQWLAGDKQPAIEITYNANGTAKNATAEEQDGMASAELLKDARSAKTFFPATVGVPFTINGLKAYTQDYVEENEYAEDGAYKNPDTQVEYYYVVLDAPRAIESAPSELNAWESYDYTGLGVMTPANEKLNITINSAKANGDIIGFRVFAVNYDGTLADPDGRAFYVAVGDAGDGGAIDVEYVATKAEFELDDDDATAAGIKAADQNISEYVEIPAEVRAKFKALATESYFSNTFEADDYATSVVDEIKIHYGLYKDNKGNAATNWKDVKFVKVVADTPENQVDESVLTFAIEGKDGNGRVVNTLTVNVKKVLPTEYAGIGWRTTMGPETVDIDGTEYSVLTVYPSPSDATFTTAQKAQEITLGDDEVNPKDANNGLYTIAWPTADDLFGEDVKSAFVDLGGYAIDMDEETYNWEIDGILATNAANATATNIIIDGVEASETQGQFAVAVNKKDINTLKDARVIATYDGVSRTSTTTNAKNVEFTAWEGKIKFASLFNELLQYSNGSYSAWALNPVKDWALKSDFYYFYDQEGLLQGKFDVDNFVYSYRAAAAATTTTAAVDEGDVPVKESAITQKKYMDIVGTGYYANATAEETTSYKTVKTYKEYSGAAWGTAYTAGDATDGGSNHNYNYFKAWNYDQGIYPASELISVDWIGTTADAKQTTRLKAKNAGLVLADGDKLSNYVSVTEGEAVLTDAAATVMTATIENKDVDDDDDTPDVPCLVLANRAGKVVTAKTANQKITLTSVVDQFGVKLPTQPSITFTLMPENAGMENSK